MKVKSKRIFIYALLLFCCVTRLAAKAKQKQNARKIPAWWESPYDAYDKDKYFAAVGNDRYRNQAELKAIETIAGFFSRNVASQSFGASLASQTKVNGASEASLSTTLSQQVLVQVNQDDLIGIEIADSFHDEIHDEWYVLALLDKEKTAELYETLIKKNSESIFRLTASGKNPPLSLQKIAYFYNAWQLSLQNERYFPRFFMISPEKCNDIKKKTQTSESIKIALDALAQKIPVFVSVSDDQNGLVRTSCEALLRSFGFAVGGSSSPYKLSVEIKPQIRTVKDPLMYYCEYSLAAKITDNSGEVFVPWQTVGRAGGKSEELARKKAYESITGKISDEYKSIFEKYLTGEDGE